MFSVILYLSSTFTQLKEENMISAISGCTKNSITIIVEISLALYSKVVYFFTLPTILQKAIQTMSNITG
jgi:hypothetical protein